MCRVFVTADEKSVHFWDMDDARKLKVIYINDLLKSHSTISTIAFSKKYRVSPPQ